MQHIELIGRVSLTAAIFEHSSMTDKAFANVLRGISRRKEFKGLTSIGNEIGE